MDEELQTITNLINKAIEFGVAYGFQILGALVFLIAGWMVAAWVGRRLAVFCEKRNVDIALSRFLGTIAKLVLVVLVIIATLGNFGISIAPLIALAGAAAFGATLAIQGPLSNYGAGLAILLSRNFGVGNTITVGKVSGVVEDITLAMTVLTSEDGERITIPNKEIVGQVIVNSRDNRIVETRIAITQAADGDRAIALLKDVLANLPDVSKSPAPQVGVHDFTYGGVILGVRVWVPTVRYFQLRYAVNGAFQRALKSNGIELLSGGAVSVAAPALTADGESG
jgi:small conductance mechanosensitive channel